MGAIGAKNSIAVKGTIERNGIDSPHNNKVDLYILRIGRRT